MHGGNIDRFFSVCGHKFGPSGRIINGQDVVPFEFPWAAAIVGTGSSENLCGGRYILTAAHCLIHRPNDPSAFQVLLHAHVLDLSIDIAHLHETNESYFKEVRGYLLPNTTDESENRIRLNVTKILIYPNFFRDGETPSNDIALLRLSRSLKLYNNENQRVGTICLPRVGELKDYTERMMTAIGT
ncbi:unnamed protein product [Orchesella dallaii]|uniref:Peptidase S1 domain-containing protein n=1 Tax=Orchesella dallaii TaxID=48710 RepID=A0ABP1PRF9_9HEXA